SNCSTMICECGSPIQGELPGFFCCIPEVLNTTMMRLGLRRKGLSSSRYDPTDRKETSTSLASPQDTDERATLTGVIGSSCYGVVETRTCVLKRLGKLFQIPGTKEVRHEE